MGAVVLRRFLPVVIAFVVEVVPASAFAVTVDQIVALSKAGVSEPIILALIDRDKTVLTIDSDELIALKKAGVSEAVIVAMLKSGRAEGDAAANANAAFNTAMFLNDLSATPQLVIIGHGPDRPNTDWNDAGYSAPFDPEFVPQFVPVPVPFGAGSFRRRGNRHALPPIIANPMAGVPGVAPIAPSVPPIAPSVRPLSSATAPALCIAHIASGPVPQLNSPGFLTVCPPPLQPKTTR